MNVNVVVSFDEKSQKLLNSLAAMVRDAAFAIRDESRRLDGESAVDPRGAEEDEIEFPPEDVEAEKPVEETPPKKSRKKRSDAGKPRGKKAPQISLDDLKRLTTELLETRGKQAVLAVLDAHKLEKMSDADPSIYPQLAVDLQNAIGG